jgi:PAS domain S-box-containing protein
MNKEPINARFGRILLVDNTTAPLPRLTDVLTAQGYTVQTVPEREHLLQFVGTNLPDLILLNIGSAGMDAYEICRRLKAQDRTRSIPVIFLGIRNDEREKVKGFQAGGADSITLPFGPDEVAARVKMHLRLRELTEGLEQKIAERTEKLTLANQRLQQEITERKQAAEALRKSEARFRIVADNTYDWEFWLGPEGNIIYMSPSCERITGYAAKEFSADPDLLYRTIHPEDRERFKAHVSDLSGTPAHHEIEYRIIRSDGASGWIGHVCQPVFDSAGNFLGRRGSNRDITERKQAEEALQRIEWMLSRKPSSAEGQSGSADDQVYGDLTSLNRGGLIARSIDKRVLRGIASEYLDLLETSSAIYEKNGDYAFGIFSSRWCRLMDLASRKLCNTEDNASALASGKWLCHESCWTCCSKQAIDTGAPVDIECSGGIRLYTVPVFAGEEVIGAINFGYGDPPTDPEKIRAIAASYALDYEELIREAGSYNTRPAFIIEIAKQRLRVSARLIGILVERKRAEEALNRLNETLEERVRERTRELERKNYDLEQMNKVFVGRELRMAELKEKIAELEKKIQAAAGKAA